MQILLALIMLLLFKPVLAQENPPTSVLPDTQKGAMITPKGKIDHTPNHKLVYCGKYAGYPRDQGTYRFPIETREKARAALAYAHWAPNPEAIRMCVCEYYPDLPTCKKYENLDQLLEN